MASDNCANCNVIDGLGESAKYLRQMLPGIPLAVLKQKYSETMIDLCERGLVWKYVFERLCVFPDVQEYRLNKEIKQDIVKVIDVYMISCGRCGDTTGECGCAESDDCEACDTYETDLMQRADIQRQGGYDQGWYEPEPGLLVFNECFDKKQCLRVSVALKPEFEGTSFPPELLKRWKKVIEYGTIAKAHLMPNQKWSDNERFGYFNGLFEEAMAKFELEQKRLKQLALNDLDSCRPDFRDDPRFNEGCRRC